MRKFITIAAALGFLGATTMTPVFAASTDISSQAAAPGAGDTANGPSSTDPSMPKAKKSMAKKHKSMGKKKSMKPQKRKPSTNNEG